jgi:hypothetical protein
VEGLDGGLGGLEVRTFLVADTHFDEFFMQLAQVTLDALKAILRVLDHLEAGTAKAVEPTFADEAGNSGSRALTAAAVDRVGPVQERLNGIF